jgi:hypothetical protein
MGASLIQSESFTERIIAFAANSRVFSFPVVSALFFG